MIGEAADVLAMAPQTNIGSSTPITTNGQDFSKDLRRKVVNDAAAYIAELAREHGRNAAAAEAMVRQAANFGAREAAAKNIVDVVSPTLPALLDEIDGRVTQPKGLTLVTAGAVTDQVEMSFWQRALDTLIDPNIIALMLSLGVVGLLVELWNPGLVLPGTVGRDLAPRRSLRAPGAARLGRRRAAAPGLARPLRHGCVGHHARRAHARGGRDVRDRCAHALRPVGPGLPGLALDGPRDRRDARAPARVGRLADPRARRNPVEVGVDRLVGEPAEVRRDGLVSVNGELWRARRADGGMLPRGERVIVEGIGDDLELVVGSHHSNEGASTP